ncbi:unnamed protein product [Cutaneotrichosporon oleaginosum]
MFGRRAHAHPTARAGLGGMFRRRAPAPRTGGAAGLLNRPLHAPAPGRRGMRGLFAPRARPAPVVVRRRRFCGLFSDEFRSRRGISSRFQRDQPASTALPLL